MKKKIITAMAFCFLTLGLFTGSLLAAPPDNFTAKMVVNGMAMPMAKMGLKSRVQTGMLQDIYTITDGGAQKTFMVNPQSKTYYEQVQQKRGEAPSVYDPNVVMEKKKLGSETVDGHPCVKSEMTFYHKDTPTQKFKGTIWEAQDLGGLPIRTEIIVEAMQKAGGSGKMVSEMKEIKVGGATASMFEVPRDYKKVNSMPELMGMGGDMQNMMKQMQKGRMPKQ
jgi:hypothetical protein